ncbi:MAG: type IV secretory system conjugative DNA transfer family protein [Rhodospirillaceae bacterium]|nr:MAG: type IV secretory system conjugative DNA transfer family protein [Rhodospirillaceae bacterium]
MAYTLGTTRRGKALTLSAEERSRHVHIVGASGTGKSKLMESMIRQDILAGRGLCLIDPHGTLADAIVQFCASRGLQSARRIHVMEPADAAWSVGFNPLRLDGVTEAAARVDAMVNACAQVWGGENTSSTPLLKKCLRAVFYALAVREQTLLEAVELINSTDPRATRRLLTENLPDYVFDSLWRDFNGLSRREFAEQFASTNNRLIEFLSSPIVRRIVGQREHALDLKQVMDNGEILIVNLAPRASLSPDNARLLGTLLTSELFLLALARDSDMARRRPFYLYVDECYDYLTGDIERMLDQTRKFGLHLVLAHQRLGQLRDRSEAIYNGVMGGGQTKIVFGGLEDDDAEIMARQIMRDSFNLERPKHVLDKPVVVDEVPFWLESESESEGDTRSNSVSYSSATTETSGTAESTSEQYEVFEYASPEQRGMTLGTGRFTGSAMTTGTSESEGYATTRSRTLGRAQTLKPIRVTMPTAVYSLEEEIHAAIVKLRELPQRVAVLKRRGRTATRVRTPEIKASLAGPELIEKFVSTARLASPYLSPTAVVDAEIHARQTELIEGKVAGTPDATDEQFWHKE